MNAIIEDFRPLVRNTLRGFTRVRLGDGMILHDVALHVRDGKAWASPPGRPQTDKTGQHMRGNDGKPLYLPTITFASRADQDAFNRAVIEAVRAKHPEALA